MPTPKKTPASKIPTYKTAAIREQMRIGREVKQALDAIIPANNRLTDAQIAAQMGISQQAVTRTVLLACYKLRMKLIEVAREDESFRPITHRAARRSNLGDLASFGFDSSRPAKGRRCW